MPDLRNKFLYQSALALSQLLFPLITYPWLTRTLGPEGLGKTGYFEFTAGLIFTLFSIGISYYGVREVAKERNNKEKLSQLTSQLFTLHLISMLAGIAVFVVIVLLNKNFSAERELLVLGVIYILVQVFALEWFLQGLEKFKFIAIRSIFIRLAGMACILLFVKNKEDYILYFGIMTATLLVVAFTSIFQAAKEIQPRFLNFSFLHHLKPLSVFFLTTSFISIYVYFDTIVLGFLTDDKTVGYYSVAIKIVKLPLLLLLTFNTILFPRIAFLNAENKTEDIQRYYRLTWEFIFTFTIPLCAGIFLMAPEIVHVIAGNEFTPSVNVIKILAALPLVISVTNFLVLQVLIPLHMEKKLVIAVLAGSICSIVLLFILIPVLNQQGAAWATLAAEFLVMLFCLLFSWKAICASFPIKSFFSSFLFSLITIPVTWFVHQQALSPLSALLIAASATIFIYFLLQYFVARGTIVSESILFTKKLFSKRDK